MFSSLYNFFCCTTLSRFFFSLPFSFLLIGDNKSGIPFIAVARVTNQKYKERCSTKKRVMSTLTKKKKSNELFG